VRGLKVANRDGEKLVQPTGSRCFPITLLLPQQAAPQPPLTVSAAISFAGTFIVCTFAPSAARLNVTVIGLSPPL